MGTPDKQFLKYLSYMLLTGLRELGRQAFYPKYLKPNDLFFDKNFNFKVGFIKVR